MSVHTNSKVLHVSSLLFMKKISQLVRDDTSSVDDLLAAEVLHRRENYLSVSDSRWQGDFTDSVAKDPHANRIAHEGGHVSRERAVHF